MNSLISLVKRNIKIFYRTKGNIFFSMLSIIILVALHFAIFRSMYADNWIYVTSQISGLIIERENLTWIADSLMFSAIIPLGAVTISLTAIGTMVADKETNALSDFLISPIKRGILLTSYLMSSFIIGFTVLSLFIIFFCIYFFVMYGITFTALQLGLIVMAKIGSLIFANIFMLLLISFLKKQQSLSTLGSILGTSIGFLSGAYIPIGMFGDIIGTLFSALPFLQLTVLTRQAFLYEIQTITPLTHEMLTGEIARNFGMEVWFGNNLISTQFTILISGTITLFLLIGLVIRFSRMKKAD